MTGTEGARAQIMEAALAAFASVGFEGASLRGIAQQAGVMHQLVVYHFKTKDRLWRDVMEWVVGPTDRVAKWGQEASLLPPAEALRSSIRSLIAFSAAHPDFHRVSILENQAETPRSHWLLQTYVKPHFDLSTRFIAAAQDIGAARPGDPARLHYGMVGIVTVPFIAAREIAAVSGHGTSSPEDLEAVEALACEFLGLRPVGAASLDRRRRQRA